MIIEQPEINLMPIRYLLLFTFLKHLCNLKSGWVLFIQICWEFFNKDHAHPLQRTSSERPPMLVFAFGCV